MAAALETDFRRDRIVRSRKAFLFALHVDALEDNLFHRLYCVTKEQFRTLISLIRRDLEPLIIRNNQVASTVTVEVMLCVTLRFLAGASYLDIGWPYGIGTLTTYKCFTRTLLALNKRLPPLCSPTTEEECQLRASQFQKLRRSPIFGIIAALDGIAIAIQRPKLSEVRDPNKYSNRKGFFAICVQAAVSADYKFLFVSARHAGGTHDSTAFQATLLHEMLSKKLLPSWVRIAADDAYCNGGYVLTPYSGYGLSQRKDAFNFFLSSCRITVEQAFGILMSRFGIFWSPLRFGVSKDTLIIMVACKLHNFIIDCGDPSCFAVLPVAEENNVIGTPTVHLQNMLHTEQEISRSRNRSREQSVERDQIAQCLSALGLTRPRVRR